MARRPHIARGIRTLGTLAGTSDYQSDALNHSATTPLAQMGNGTVSSRRVANLAPSRKRAITPEVCEASFHEVEDVLVGV